MNVKNIYLILLAMFAGISLCGRNRTQKKHDYLVILNTQTDPMQGSKTMQVVMSGSKFSATDVGILRTNAMAGNTNMTVIVLNIIKLDD